MNQEIDRDKIAVRLVNNNAERQRQHVKRKQDSHLRLQCWISHQHTYRLQQLSQRLEDHQASLIEQAIDLLYQHEFDAEMVIPEFDPNKDEEVLLIKSP